MPERTCRRWRRVGRSAYGDPVPIAPGVERRRVGWIVSLPPAGHEGVAFLGGGEFDHPRDATITLIVRSHGPAIPGMQREQFGTVSGGCLPGQPNAGMCEDIQAVLY